VGVEVRLGAEIGVDAAAGLRAGAERLRSAAVPPTPCLPLLDIACRRASAASRPLDFRFALLAMCIAVGFVSVGWVSIGIAG
jgi:hypothetical protein